MGTIEIEQIEIEQIEIGRIKMRANCLTYSASADFAPTAHP